jgi:CRP/FNR family cyclic AMP-dependent transcriptional regulator
MTLLVSNLPGTPGYLLGYPLEEMPLKPARANRPIAGRSGSLGPMATRDLLAGAEMFKELVPAELDRLVSASSELTLRRNETVFSQEQNAGELYVVSSGRIAIVTRSPDRRESMIALMEPGDLFGEMGLLEHEPRSAEARALEPSTLVVVPYEPVREVLEGRPALLWGVVRMLAHRLRVTDSALADSVFLDVPGRTAKRLLDLAGDRDEFVLPVTQEELAGLVGASRERVNKAIATFVKLGWLDQSDRRYRILERAQLSQRAT